MPPGAVQVSPSQPLSDCWSVLQQDLLQHHSTGVEGWPQADRLTCCGRCPPFRYLGELEYQRQCYSKGLELCKPAYVAASSSSSRCALIALQGKDPWAANHTTADHTTADPSGCALITAITLPMQLAEWAERCVLLSFHCCRLLTGACCSTGPSTSTSIQQSPTLLITTPLQLLTVPKQQQPQHRNMDCGNNR
jgi:hypothetical protein